MMASMYENTGISLGILLQGVSPETAIPVLPLTFDGTGNDNDRTKVDSFLYYLGNRRQRLLPGRRNNPPPSQTACERGGHEEA
mgnify:CR=1 FL=1